MFQDLSRNARTTAGLEALEPRQMLSAVVAPAGLPDLTVQFGNTKSPLNLPATDVSGDMVKFAVPITISNQGVGPTASAHTLVNLYARPTTAVDNSQDVLIATLPKAGLGKLQPGAGKSFNLTAVLPLYLATGGYHVVAVINGDNAVSESTTANDSAVSTQTINVTAGVVDLQAGKVKLNSTNPVIPTGVVTRATVSVVITNAGDVPLPKGQKIVINVYARPLGAADSSGDILIAAADKSVSALKPSRTFTQNIALNALPTSLPDGSYTLVVVLDSTDVVTESNENNNTATSVSVMNVSSTAQTGGGGGSGGGGGTSTPVDLSITNATTTLAASDPAATTGQAVVTFSNAGSKTAAGSYTINVYAVASGDSNLPAILVGTTGSQTYNLAAGAAASPVTISLTLPSPSASTIYELVAVIASSSGDSNPSNDMRDIRQVTVAPGASTGLPGLSAPLLFTQTIPPVVIAGLSTSSGTFSSGANSGNYVWAVNTTGGNANTGTLTLTVNGVPGLSIVLTLATLTGNAPTSLDGRTIAFTTTSVGATGGFTGAVQPLGTAVPAGFFILT